MYVHIAVTRGMRVKEKVKLPRCVKYLSSVLLYMLFEAVERLMKGAFACPQIGVAEAQGRSRKSIENSVDKAGKSLHEWRNIAMKSKKQSFSSARENERLQDLARLQSISQSQQSNNKSSNHHMTEKEASKLEARRRKAEDSSRRADTEFYTVSVRAERARLEYESTVRKGAKQMELLEEERLSALKDLANVYLAHLQALAPRLQQVARFSND